MTDKEKEMQKAYMNGDPNDSINVGVKVIKLSVTETVLPIRLTRFRLSVLPGIRMKTTTATQMCATRPASPRE